MKEIEDYNEYIKFKQIGFVLSEENKRNKKIQEPFLKRLLLNREQCTKVEQELYNFILANWLWCLPVYKDRRGQSVPDKCILIGYRMLDKESVMRQAFDFG